MIEAIVAIILLLGLGTPENEPPELAQSAPEQPLELPEQAFPEESHRDLEQIWKRLQQLPPPEEFSGDRLGLPFEILDGGALVISWDRRVPILMISPPEDLYLVLSDEVVRLDTIAQLRGRVAIGSAEQALAFCRLLTSPRTYDLWWPARRRMELEIMGAAQVDSDVLFGKYWSSSHLQYLRREAPDFDGTWRHEAQGYYGIVSSRQKLDEIGIRPAQARPILEGYEIERTLMVWDHDARCTACHVGGGGLPNDHNANRNHMERVVEIVGYDGSYVRTESDLDDLPTGVRWGC